MLQTNSKTQKNIMVINDHPVVRVGISAIVALDPNLTVCCEVGSLEAAIVQMTNCAEPLDLAIVDLSLSKGLGLSLFRKLKAIIPNIRILVFSWQDEKVYAEQVIKAGGHGYIMSNESEQTLLVAVNSVLNGDIYVSKSIHEALLNNMRESHQHCHTPTDITHFTSAELSILELLSAGKTRSESASYLNRSVKTVDAHCTNIKRKMNLPNNRLLIQFAIQSSGFN